MDCRELQDLLQLFLDGEIDERDRGEVEGHLSECCACRRQAEFERRFRETLRCSFVADPPPPRLCERIRAELGRAAAPRWHLQSLAPAVPVAAVLLVGMLLGYIWSLTGFAPFGDESAPRSQARAEIPPAAPQAVSPPGPTPPPAAPAVAKTASIARAPEIAQEDSEREARPPRVARAKKAAPPAVEEEKAEAAGEQELPVEVASSDPSEIAAYLRERLGRWVRVPTFHGRARLVGGTASSEARKAQLVYRYGDQHITLHVSAKADSSLPAQGIVVRPEGAHRVARWRLGGLTFSMTSLLDPAEMVRLVSDELRVQNEAEALARARRRAEEEAFTRWLSPPEPNYSEATTVSRSAP